MKKGLGAIVVLLAVGCDPSGRARGDAVAPRASAMPLTTIEVTAPSAPEMPKRAPGDHWRALPASAEEAGLFFDELCEHVTDEGEDAWRDAHLPPGDERVIGHEPFTNEAGTHTWATAEVLTPTMARWAKERTMSFCDRSRTVQKPTVVGIRGRGEMVIGQQPFGYTIALVDGTARLERLTMLLKPTTGKPKLMRVPQHEVMVDAHDMTETAAGKKAAHVINLSVQASLCFEAHVVAEEEDPDGELVSHFAVVTLDDVATVLSDGLAPKSLLRCLQNELRDSLPAMPSVKSFRESHPELARKPVARIRMLVVLQADEIDPDTPMVTGP